MIPVSMDENGPNMDEVENLIENNKSICGIWCVPKYSNQSGIIYSEKNI
jgi:DNA-binding transcriptional MocR family regulator